MKKKVVFIVLGLFVVINLILLFVTFHPTALIPLLSTKGKDQIYYYSKTYYALGNYYRYVDNSRFVFVGKLQNVYEKDNNVYATVQLTNSPQNITPLNIFLQSGRLRFVSHPIDDLIGIYNQSNSQLLNSAEQVIYNASQYKEQNLVFFVALPEGVKIPPTQDPTILALMKKPEIVKLIAAQQDGANCGAQLLKEFQTKQFKQLGCTPHISEIHVNTGSWKH